MAPESGRDAASLKQELLEETERFEFFQAVRLFQRIWGEREPVGSDADPLREAVHFRSDISASFPIGDVAQARAPEEGPGELLVSFLGVATPNSFGSLPRVYAEEIRRQVRDRNPALRDFLDLFNHRFVSLFYRAWEKHRPVALYGRRGDNPFERALYGVLGLGTQGLSRRLGLDDRILLARAGLLAMRPMPASALEGLIRSVFGVPVTIVQFVPAVYEMEQDDQNRLGVTNTCLGLDLYLGFEVTLVQSKFRVRIGALDLERYQEFLPDRPGFYALSQLVRLAVGEHRDFDVNLLLREEDVPALRLGEPDHIPRRLGWTSWLAERYVDGAADDAIFEPALMSDGPTAPYNDLRGGESMEVRP